MSLEKELIPSLDILSISKDINTQTTTVNLSNLGVETAGNNDLGLLWEVLGNLWDPKFNPEGYVSLGAAENALMHDTLTEYLRTNFELSSNALTYGEGGLGSSRLRKALAHFLNRRMAPMVPIQKEHVTMTNGCSSAIEHCTFMFTNPNDGILLGQPYYGTFVADIQLRPRAKVVKVSFGHLDPMCLDAAQCYEDALTEAESSGTKVKALMLCNPHNPLGRCYSREIIASLMRLCQKHRIHFISDEIYAFSVFENREDKSPPQVEFTSALSVDLTGIIDPHRVHVLWGMSKDFGANGIRIGAIISQANPIFVQALQIVSLYSYPSGMIDTTIAKLLEDDNFTDTYIAENQRKLSTQHSLVVQFLKSHNIEYAPGVNAAFFLWLNLGKAYMDRHPDQAADDISATIMNKLLAKKVFLASGIAFGSEKPGWFRLVFSQQEQNLMEGLRRMLSVIEE